ncbi:hypothetical protein BJY04DRAFT_209825 [Aspergillus karnatakaensis]|uniref:MOSC domain-containing protein n=1 Tax=Aspergillus karnatakaensis TaxID=1810916 RepID=UPI003CCDE93B
MAPILLALIALFFLASPFLLRLIRQAPTNDPQTKNPKPQSKLNSRPSSQPASQIVSLRVYPIKSCRGFEIKETRQCLSGLDMDRRWMVVDSKTKVFLTIRQIPEMTLVRTGLSDDGESLVISIAESNEDGAHSKGESVSVPAHPDTSWLQTNTTLVSDVKIWDTVTDGYIYNSSVGVNQLLSSFLKRDVALVYKGPMPRILKGNADPRLLGRVQDTGFPDVLPVLIASQASIDELNSRLRKQGHEEITIERFRPNIIVQGEKGKPWVEDSWKTVRISSSSGGERKDITFDIVARCGRCQVPNVDPVTAEKHKNQPWDTLMKYRRVDEGLKYKPCFGMLGVPRGEGGVAVGDRFEVLEETDEHFYIKGF